MLNSKTQHDKNREIPITSSGKTKINFLMLILSVMSVMNVKAQTLSFTYSPDTIYVGDTVTFTNTSTGFDTTVRWVWNYGDTCSTCNDTLANNSLITQYYYSTKGEYVVTLYAIEENGDIIESLNGLVYIHSLDV